jgi:hypothetical protein
MSVVEVKKPTKHKDDIDNVYYNVRIRNTTLALYKPAVYSVNRVAPILEKPDEYEMAVVRFSVPSTNIPIMLFGEQPYDPITNPSSKVDKLIISMSFDGAVVEKPLLYQPVASADSSIDALYGPAIWSYQQFIDMINVALKSCFDDLKALKPLAPPTIAPNMIYNPVTELCSLYAEQLYDTGNPALPPAPPATIKVFFNNALHAYFPSLQTFEQEDLEPQAFQLLIKNNFNNSATISGTPYYYMEQEYRTLELWNDFNNIVFETNSIPVEPEFQPTEKDVSRRLITDFEPVENINNRQKLQYFGVGWKRYYDLKSAYPLRRIDLNIYWEDNEGKLYPIYISYDEALTIKILFRKKHTLRSLHLDDKQDEIN